MTGFPRPAHPPLADAAARDAILRDTDVNLVVEAAAGTGKTTCLVGRLLTLFKGGALAGDSRLAAVTFTHKAAAELRERLAAALDAALADPEALSPDELANLRAAEAGLAECHIGTIHSFCARLLRERPVEAGVPPDFQEVDDATDMALREQAWAVLADQISRGRHDDVYRVFAMFGMDPSAVGGGFIAYCGYPDVTRWPGGRQDMATIDVAAFLAGVGKYNGRALRFAPALDAAEAGRDELIPLLRTLSRRLERLSGAIGLDEAFRLSGIFKANPNLVQRNWGQLGLKKEEAKEELAVYAAFYEEVVKPFRDACLDAVYGAALTAFARAKHIYDQLRREKGWLNFQDLLLLTARMLRDYPDVRADLADRYARLLVDEVQDTDPIQAEILFFLAGRDTEEREWRLCAPRPGSLFMVGDPKQSIFRFRRADIAAYQEMKKLIVQAGGRELGLSSNFRSQPAILDWVNRTFCPEDADSSTSFASQGDADSGRNDNDPSAQADSARLCPEPPEGCFSRRESVYSPAYIPLDPGLPPPPPDAFSGVFALEMAEVKPKDGMTERQALLDEAARIASFIKGAVDSGLALPRRDGTAPARPGDFLIVTPTNDKTAPYAAALRRLGLACRVSGGGTLRDSPALAMLLSYLAALDEPDNPILSVAVLRGGLFGVSDVLLRRWRRAGGDFLILSKRPAGMEEGCGIRPIAANDSLPEFSPSSPVATALDVMARHHRLFFQRDPVSALERVVDDLGLWPFSCLGEDPANGAAALAAAVDLVGAERLDLATLGQLRERLEYLIRHHKEDPLPATRPEDDAVRVMNIHKAKGLEAPVVFLASTRGGRKHAPTFSVRRSPDGIACAMTLSGGESNRTVHAYPLGWDELAAEEERFLDAERIRLNYVAATRAGAALVVTVHKSDGKWKSGFLPGGLRGGALPDLLPEPAPAVPDAEGTLECIDAAELEEIAAARAGRLAALVAPSYAVARAKQDGDWRRDLVAGDADDDAADDNAMLLGEALHKLLERDGGDDADAVGEVLREYGLDGVRADEAAAMLARVRETAVWARAGRSERVFREVPFTLARDGGEVIRGVVDLVFREDGGWVVVDYKSDRFASGMTADSAARRHVRQLAAYAEAWRRLTGETVKEAGVCFLRTGEYIVMEV